MNKRYLILDCPYLCHRAKYSTGELSYGGEATGVIYGFLKSLSAFQDFFRSSDFIFCFDSNVNKRYEIYPEYKSKRKEQKEQLSKEEIRFENDFQRQVKKLKTTYLKTIGFKNVFFQRGYEADDIIASVCDNILDSDEAIIISSDKDLYQCIKYNVSLYNPQSNKILTLQSFKKQYGIEAVRWGLVKALAGCSTDNVRGIKGVGEKTAIKYLLNQLKVTSKAYKEITSLNGVKTMARNRNLVLLPFIGTKNFKIEKDCLSEKGWKQVIDLLGMKSLRDKFPFRRNLR